MDFYDTKYLSCYNFRLSYRSINITYSRKLVSRELVMRVNQGLIEQRRVSMEELPARVAESIRSTHFTREQLTQSFANARRRVAEVA